MCEKGIQTTVSSFQIIVVVLGYSRYWATAMVDYFMINFKKSLPFSEIDVVMVSDVDAYDSPSWFLCTRANLQVWHFLQQLSWWRLFYPVTLLLVPHYIPGKFIRARILNSLPSHMLDESQKNKKQSFSTKIIRFWKSLFSPQGERRYYIASENIGFYNFLVSTFLGMLFIVLGRQLFNSVYNKGNIPNTTKPVFNLVPYTRDSKSEHETIFSWLYLDMVVVIAYSFIFPSIKFISVNLCSLNIKKKFCIFRCYDTMAFGVFLRTVFTGSPISLPFIGGYYIADPRFNYTTKKGREIITFVGFPFLVLCLLMMFVVALPLSSYRCIHLGWVEMKVHFVSLFTSTFVDL